MIPGYLKPYPPPPHKISDLRELQKWPMAFRVEQLFHLLHTSYATGKRTNILLYTQAHSMTVAEKVKRQVGLKADK